MFIKSRLIFQTCCVYLSSEWKKSRPNKRTAHITTHFVEPVICPVKGLANFLSRLFGDCAIIIRTGIGKWSSCRKIFSLRSGS